MIASSLHKNAFIVECPVCGSPLNFRDKKTDSIKAELVCTKCASAFPFEGEFLNLLPPKIRAEICKSGVISRKIKDKLRLGKLTKDEHDLIRGILASNNMAKQYFKNVVHPTDAAWSARSYERFEEIFIIQYLNKLLKNKKVAFIDAGSGPGRYLLLLGSKISADSCKELKKDPQTGILYKYDKIYDRNLTHIIGIDYSAEMTGHSAKWLRRYGLGDYIHERIFPINGVAQNFHLNRKIFDDMHKVLVCTFQTLGNQENHDLQVQMLRSMRDLAMPHGTIIVSVFNKRLFKEFGLKKFYGREVRRTVGGIITSKEDERNHILRTTKGVYSKWFSREDLDGLFGEAGLTDYTIMDERTLKPISGYERYLKKEEQVGEVFPRAILGIARIDREDK